MQCLLTLTLFSALQFVYGGVFDHYYRQRFLELFLIKKVRYCRAKTLGIAPEPLNIPLYTRTFNYILDGKFEGLTKALVQDVDRFKAHQACLGRKSNYAIIQQGQRALQYFADAFGVDIRGDVSVEDLIDGNLVLDLPGGRVRYQTYVLSMSSRYRMFSETKGLRCKVYEENLISNGGWVIVFEDKMNLNGGVFKGSVDEGDSIYFADNQFFTDLEGPRQTVAIHFESIEPLRAVGSNYLLGEQRITNPDYGVGSEFLTADVDSDAQRINARTTATFPGQV